MKRIRSPRLVLVGACLAAAVTGAVIAADRSSSAMADAATAFLGSLTPEQRQKATFPFDSAERFHWNFRRRDLLKLLRRINENDESRPLSNRRTAGQWRAAG